MNILWTGSHGFIAGYTIEKLLEMGHHVWGIDNFWKYGKISKSYDKHKNFHFVEGDAKDSKLLLDIMTSNNINIFVAGAAIIGGIAMFHELAYDIISENEKITCAAFDACIKYYKDNSNTFNRIVVISSSMVFENIDIYPSKESDLNKCPSPSSTYGFQKLSTEYFAKGASIQYGLPYTIVRPFNAIGIGEQRSNVGRDIYSGNIKLCMSHVLPDLILKIYKGQNPLHILGNGNQIRHYTYAGDIADAIITCMFHINSLNNDFNISTDIGHTVIDLANVVWKFMGNTDTLTILKNPSYQWDVQKRIPDVTKARSLLNINCNTPLESSLKEIVPWIIQQIQLGTI